MSKTLEQIVSELDQKIPRDVIESRDGGGGRKLSYLAGWYVIDRLNKVLGHGNWSYTSEATMVHSGELEGKYGKTYSTHYIAKVTLYARFPHQENKLEETYFEDYGYGDGTDKTNLGKTHELAIKEAVTDGIKRCAKNLGMSMGLALYDKTQENVGDEEEILVNDSKDPFTLYVPHPASGSTTPVAATPSSGNKEETEEAIRSYVRVATAQKRLTGPDFKKWLKSEYQVEKIAELELNQLSETLEYLKGLTK